MSTYEPGTVAVATVRGVPNVRVFRVEEVGRPWVSHVPIKGDGYHDAPADVTDVRPLVVLDVKYPRLMVPALRDVADRVGESYSAPVEDIADQIEAQTKPPKPEVYEHLVYQRRGKTSEAVCGKVWIPGAEVTVVGRCPECARVADLGWSA